MKGLKIETTINAFLLLPILVEEIYKLDNDALKFREAYIKKIMENIDDIIGEITYELETPEQLESRIKVISKRLHDTKDIINSQPQLN